MELKEKKITSSCTYRLLAQVRPLDPSTTVENNGCLAVKPKTIKLTYAETVRIKKTVGAQNRLIGNGGDPTNNLNNVDIKKK